KLVADVLHAGLKLDALRSVERIRDDPDRLPVRLSEQLRLFDVGGLAVPDPRALGETAEEVGDLLNHGTPVQAPLAVFVRHESGYVDLAEGTVHLRHRHEVLIAQHAAPVERRPASEA